LVFLFPIPRIILLIINAASRRLRRSGRNFKGPAAVWLKNRKLLESISYSREKDEPEPASRHNSIHSAAASNRSATAVRAVLRKAILNRESNLAMSFDAMSISQRRCQMFVGEEA
jgi:hypothetical protein